MHCHSHSSTPAGPDERPWAETTQASHYKFLTTKKKKKNSWPQTFQDCVQLSCYMDGPCYTASNDSHMLYTNSILTMTAWGEMTILTLELDIASSWARQKLELRHSARVAGAHNCHLSSPKVFGFDSQYEDTVGHSGEGLASRVWGCQSHCVPS